MSDKNDTLNSKPLIELSQQNDSNVNPDNISNQQIPSIQTSDQKPTQQEEEPKTTEESLNKSIIEQEPLGNSFYFAYFTLLIPLSSGLAGLTNSDDLLNGSLPTFTLILFILIFIISIINLLYLIICQIYISKSYTISIPLHHKKKIILPWAFCWLLFIIIFGLSFKDQTYIYKQCDYEQIWDNSALTTLNNASKLLCTETCPCYLQLRNSYSAAEILNLSQFITVNKKNAINISGCPAFGTKDDIFFQFKEIEQSWNCSGICTRSPLYYFTDVNRGPPLERRGCLQVAIEDYLPSYMNLIKYSSVFVILTHITIIGCFLYSKTNSSDTETNQNQNSLGTIGTNETNIQRQVKQDNYDILSKSSGDDLNEDQNIIYSKPDFKLQNTITGMSSFQDIKQLQPHERLSVAYRKESKIFKNPLFGLDRIGVQRHSVVQETIITSGSESKQPKGIDPPTQRQFLEALKLMQFSPTLSSEQNQQKKDEIQK